MIRRALVTVRLPGARMAPIRRTCAQSQTRWENSGRNARMTNASSAGKVGIKHYISHLLHTLTTLYVCINLAHDHMIRKSRREPCPSAPRQGLHRGQQWIKSSSDCRSAEQGITDAGFSSLDMAGDSVLDAGVRTNRDHEVIPA